MLDPKMSGQLSDISDMIEVSEESNTDACYYISECSHVTGVSQLWLFCGERKRYCDVY